ncbi:MAG TPA: 50S ribosomal protein L18 [Candidatus Caccopulliclostridium gallistercoris]|uniref:Large ribosomal subunit protein uL18 n=1 Tax=Candidatus Caccopulliclostridium gallistercoris TaxID=2840719 RepID=A0A9D1SYR0_9FIRM|nr:50S ribosomal protein L18 [Candidatus Caccopulliclostridium gallistercoris]
MIGIKDKNKERVVRHARVRKNLSGTTECPRLCVYRSLNGIYAQIIDDSKGATLASCSTLEKDLEKELKGKSKTEQAKVVGAKIAKLALDKGIKTVVFDRGGYLYTGRVQALADAAREAGLEF